LSRDEAGSGNGESSREAHLVDMSSEVRTTVIDNGSELNQSPKRVMGRRGREALFSFRIGKSKA
jgi:hypothetical protein